MRLKKTADYLWKLNLLIISVTSSAYHTLISKNALNLWMSFKCQISNFDIIMDVSLKS